MYAKETDFFRGLLFIYKFKFLFFFVNNLFNFVPLYI